MSGGKEYRMKSSSSLSREPSTSVSSALEGALSGLTELTFDQAGDFAAYHAAERWLSDRGFSLGHMQRGAPCGIMRGDWDIQKWRNLSNQDRRELDGTLSGDFRNGPVVIRVAKATGPSSAPQPRDEPIECDSSRADNK